MEAAIKGKEVISSLLSAGIPIGSTNPISGKFIWNSIGLSWMLYGTELWSHFTNSDIAVLERVNRIAAKRFKVSPSTLCQKPLSGTLVYGLFQVTLRKGMKNHAN